MDKEEEHSPEARGRLFSLLRARRFSPLFVTQFLGAFNDNVFKNALLILITFSVIESVREQSAMLVTLAQGVFILPFFLFSAIAGQFADKLEKSALIRRVKLAEIVIMGLAVLGFWWGNVWALIGILFLMGSQSSLFGPLKYSILPQHLPPEELTAGNGLVQMGTFLAILLGTMLGGFAVSIEENGVTVVSVIVMLLAISGWLASREIPRAEPANAEIRIGWNIISQTHRVIAYAREDRLVFACVLAIAWFWFVGATFLQLLPSFTRDVLNGGPQVVTVMLTAFSIGIGVGSLICAAVSRGKIELRLVPVGALGLGAFTVGVYFLAHSPNLFGDEVLGLTEFAANPDNWWVFIDLVLVSVSGGIYIVPLVTLVQSRAGRKKRAQVIAASNVLSALFMVVSALTTLWLLSVGRTTDEILLIVGITSFVLTGGLLLAVPAFTVKPVAPPL